MTMTSLSRNSWLLDSAADMHVCNNRSSFADDIVYPTDLAGSTYNGTSPGRGMIRITLASEDDTPSSVLVLNNVLYILQCPVNLVSLGLLNQHKVYFDNLNWNLFLLSTRDIIGYAPRVNTNFMLKTLYIPNLAIHLTRIEADIFQWPETAIYHTSSKVKLTTWHAHLNISSCRKYLKGLSVPPTSLGSPRLVLASHTTQLSHTTQIVKFQAFTFQQFIIHHHSA